MNQLESNCEILQCNHLEGTESKCSFSNSRSDDWRFFLINSQHIKNRRLLDGNHSPAFNDKFALMDGNLCTNKHNSLFGSQKSNGHSNGNISSQMTKASNSFFNNLLFNDNSPNLLLHTAIPFLLLGCIFADLFTWTFSICLYIVFRLLNSDYGRRALITIPRDLKGLYILLCIKFHMYLVLHQNKPIHIHFMRFVQKHPDKKCVIEVETNRALTFAEFNDHANKYSNLFKSFGFRKDDVLALFMENGIEFFAAWLGMSKLGVITAWINTNLKLEPLTHSIKVAHCKAVLTTPTLLPVLMKAVSSGLVDSNLKIFVAMNGERVVEALQEEDSDNYKTTIEHSLENTSEPKIPEGLTFQSILCYIYTSGTTGNPKAAIIKHYRFYLVGLASGTAFGVRSSDRLYIMMPMYHSAGGILGSSQVIIRGCSACIRTKFSAKNFWKDCIKFECTVSQYIGEICRYLLAQPPSSEDKLHKIRMMYGNGLRPQIWLDFVQRFNIKKIGELYGSTEGNSNLVNINNYTGACGFMPIYTFLHSIYPIRLLKVDSETGELVKNSKGYYIQCKPGDIGEVVGTIRTSDPLLRFEGYVNSGDTQKKIIQDCFGPGDTVFTSGDILYWDRLGYLYFKDRRGDTYRWRGENVSTMEVEGVLQPIKCILDATVFGVQVPGREGRAGMIGVALVNGTDVEEFIEQISARLVDQLASYAIPVFLRICEKVDKTGTFKMKKNALQNYGYDLIKCTGNSVFYWDATAKRYLKLTEEMQIMIDNGEYNKI